MVIWVDNKVLFCWFIYRLVEFLFDEIFVYYCVELLFIVIVNNFDLLIESILFIFIEEKMLINSVFLLIIWIFWV